MRIARKLRKRLTRNPARAEDISQAFQKFLGRPATESEITHWEQKYLSRRALERRLAKAAPSGRRRQAGGAGADVKHPPHLVSLSDEDFVEYVCLNISGRFPAPIELQTTASQLRSGAIDRNTLMLAHFAQAAREETARRTPQINVGTKTKKTGASPKLKKTGASPSLPIMGTPQTISMLEWQRAARFATAPERQNTHARFPLQPRQSEVDVSVICSLWRGGDFIERYMENITSQTIFTDRCELIVIDAASPDGESQVIERYKARFGDRIIYHRMPYRAGIYAAWNYGVGIARGRYLTNANLDDLRRIDSLERQASALDALSFVDVVYDDHLYFCDPQATFDLIERVGVASELPLVTRSNLFTMNPLHNGPMWRASLHDRIGYFDETYRSAGDYDFWIRATINGATFYKLNEPTVGYYFNPDGLSTSNTGVGILEPRLALRRHGAQLIPEASRESPEKFLKRLGFAEWPEGRQGPASRYALVQLKMRELAGRHGPRWSGR